MRPVRAGTASFDGTRLGIIAGPCVIESEGLLLEVATELRRITRALDLPFIFKASYAKDNRSSVRSFRGPGLENGLGALAAVRERLQVPVLSDVHTPEEVPIAARELDVLQIPAFLCRQTSLLEAAGRSGKPVNIKKGQFLAPRDLVKAVEKVRASGSDQVLVTERGTTFGYHDLVVDMRSIAMLAETGCPVVYDATHSLQQPGTGEETGGLRQFARPLARAAVAAGADALFFETHPEPARALSDRATQLPLAEIPAFLEELVRVWNAVRHEPATTPGARA
ncbi:MAG TPA: 3-deoxy-8-phosphooctulonate synthase [Candidatus Eisenbacteria bacterium]|nr:3-deoxy-8-phosphooctulonate synthase [Candidatus Eisenbacteria bacterium]